MEVIKIAVGHSSFRPLLGKLWMIDARNMDVRVLNLQKQKNCPVCAKAPAEILLQNYSPVCSANIVREISVAESRQLENATLIDVRERAEWENGHMPKAHHLPLSLLQKNPQAFAPRSKGPSILYCQKGKRSKKAVELLLAAGFSNVYSLQGGYEAWEEANRT